MDKIFIEGLQIETVIGVFDWEREIKQTVTIDLEMSKDIRPAAASDDLQYALDYKAISDRIIEFVEASSFQLIETMAESIAELVRQEFGVDWLRLTLGKPGAVPAARTVGVQIERGMKQGVDY